MGVSENSGTPKSSILIGFSIINHPFWGYPYFWKHPHKEQKIALRQKESKIRHIARQTLGATARYIEMFVCFSLLHVVQTAFLNFEPWHIKILPLPKQLALRKKNSSPQRVLSFYQKRAQVNRANGLGCITKTVGRCLAVILFLDEPRKKILLLSMILVGL